MAAVTGYAEDQTAGPSWALMGEDKGGSRASCAEHPSRSWEYASALMEGQRDLGDRTS